jgi:hypothetical protein
MWLWVLGAVLVFGRFVVLYVFLSRRMRKTLEAQEKFQSFMLNGMKDISLLIKSLKADSEEVSSKVLGVRLKVDEFTRKLVEKDRLFIHSTCEYQFLVPRSLIQLMVDNNRIGQIKREHDYLHELRLDIESRGLREALEIVYDENGFVRLQEGHHRFLILNYSMLPVNIIKVNKANSRFNLKNIESLFRAIDLSGGVL